MDALLAAVANSEKVEEEPGSEEKAEGTPNSKAYNRKTRPTHTAYQKAVMTRCALPPRDLHRTCQGAKSKTWRSSLKLFLIGLFAYMQHIKRACPTPLLCLSLWFSLSALLLHPQHNPL